MQAGTRLPRGDGIEIKVVTQHCAVLRKQNCTGHCDCGISTAFAHYWRDRVVERWLGNVRPIAQNGKYAYLGEFLPIMRLLGSNVINMRMDALCDKAIKRTRGSAGIHYVSTR